jgi:hypothetical protein
MKNIGGSRSTGSIDSLIWQAQAVSKDVELSAKRDLAVENKNRFDEAIQARRDAAGARFAKGQNENKSSFWTTVGTIAGLAVGVMVAAALAVPTGGASIAAGLAVVLAGAAGGSIPGLVKLMSVLTWERDANKQERRASESDIRATEAQRAADTAKEEAQAAHDRFRSILDDAKALDQMRLRAAGKE